MLPKLIVFPPKRLPFQTHSSETFLGKHTKRPLLPQSKERYAASKSKSTAILSATNCGSIPDDDFLFTNGVFYHRNQQSIKNCLFCIFEYCLLFYVLLNSRIRRTLRPTPLQI